MCQILTLHVAELDAVAHRCSHEGEYERVLRDAAERRNARQHPSRHGAQSGSAREERSSERSSELSSEISSKG